MLLQKFAAAKGEGRKQLIQLDNMFGLLFMLIVFTYATARGHYVFSYFSMGLIVARIGEIIFEIKHNLFDRPFFHWILIVGIPAQLLWDAFVIR